MTRPESRGDGWVEAGRGLAHEVRNRLGVVLGSLDLALERTEDPAVRADLERALAAVLEIEAALDLAHRLLRSQGGENTPCDLPSLLSDFVRAVEGEGGRVELDLSEVGPCRVRIPPAELEDLLFGLSWGGEGGRIALSSSGGEGRVRLELETASDLPRGRKEAWERFRWEVLGARFSRSPRGFTLLLPLED